jgi:hypothetical protein
MKTVSVRSVVVTPPPADVREAREADRRLQTAPDPQEAVLIYGHMITDVEILRGELTGLLFAGADYRSKLRVVRSAAIRLADRAAKLLGEAKL